MRRSARFSTLALVAALVPLSAAPAQAASGLYLQLGLGMGTFTGSELAVQEQPVPGDLPLLGNECCPPPSLASQFRLGYSLFGFGGPEFTFVGAGWRLGGDDSGGAGFIGGGLRAYPIKFVGLFTGLDTNDFPLDIGVGLSFGYSLAGQDFAYTGSFWDLDISFEYKLGSFVSAGIKFDAIFPSYSDFVFTSYSNDRGRCLNGDALQTNPDGSTDPLAAGAAKDGLTCAGRGPKTILLSPQVVVTFHFDLFGA
ncbi:MAG: hypothetical protein IPG45_17130 [Deltaproteobacteria bacterium]|nr:hypothetical protein [Deltaproteobacteria bacterium]